MLATHVAKEQKGVIMFHGELHHLLQCVNLKSRAQVRFCNIMECAVFFTESTMTRGRLAGLDDDEDICYYMKNLSLKVNLLVKTNVLM